MHLRSPCSFLVGWVARLSVCVGPHDTAPSARSGVGAQAQSARHGEEIHGVLISNKRVHLYGPRFADVGVHHNLRTMFADMGPVQVDSSEDETSAKQESLPMKSGLAEETVDVLEPLEAELEARMSWDGELSTCVIHMGKALKVVRDTLRPARAELQRSSVCVDGSAGAFDFDSSSGASA